MKFMEIGSRMVVTRLWGKGEMRTSLMDIGFYFCEMKKFLEICQHISMNILNTTELYTQKLLRW